MNVFAENRVISKIETNYLKNKFGQTYIALEDFFFFGQKKKYSILNADGTREKL